jgi:hypothetical protein
MTTKRSAWFAVSSLAVVFTAALSAAPEPTLGKKGALLLEETFSGGAVPAGWTKNAGAIAVADGALRANEVAKDNHAGAFRKALPLTDAAVQVDLKLDGAASFNLGFDPAPGALKKQGHLFSLIVTPTSWQITEHVNKADPASKNIVHAKAAANFPRDRWVTILLEMKGDTVVVHADGQKPLKATAKDFAVKKPGLVFRVGGKDEKPLWIDNVKVWALSDS